MTRERCEEWLAEEGRHVEPAVAREEELRDRVLDFTQFGEDASGIQENGGIAWSVRQASREIAARSSRVDVELRIVLLHHPCGVAVMRRREIVELHDRVEDAERLDISLSLQKDRRFFGESIADGRAL